MSKKNKEPKQPKAKKPLTPFNKELKTGLIIALALVLLFSTGNFLGALTSKNFPGEDASSSSAAPVEQTSQPTAPQTQPSSEPAATQPAASQPAESQPAESQPAESQPAESQPAESQPAASEPAASTGAPQTPAEIISYYNTAANKIKTEASKVTRNYADKQHNPEHLVVPSALQTIGSGLISTFLKRDDTVVDFTGADIDANFPIKGTGVVSKLTEADVAEATCTDNGSSYAIKIKLNESVDPNGTGVANGMDVIKAEEVYEAASVVQNFTAKYYDCTIEATVDKASGHVSEITFTQPIIMNVTAKVLVTLDAQVGMTFTDNYTITY